MWKLYCAPGRFLAEIGYLFPKRGELWATKRRRESGLVYFIYATPFWLVFGFFAIALVGAIFHPSHQTSAHVTDKITAPTPVSAPANDHSSAPADLVFQPPTSRQTQRGATPAAEGSAAAPVSSDAGPLSEIERDPQSVPQIKTAMQASFDGGTAQRWHASHLEGYAVAGSPGADGCKLVRVSIDSAPDAIVETAKLCPPAGAAQ